MRNNARVKSSIMNIMSRPILAVVVNLLFIAAVCAAEPAQPPAPRRESFGVWLQVNHNQPFDSDVKDNRLYKGVMLGKAWSAIERADGDFDWKRLDRNLEQAADLGLYCALGIAAGPMAPTWIYDRGVPRVMTEGHPRNGPYPYYMDARFMAYYHRMI